ncbi:MAG: sel1 repeat family protein [Bacteroidaceae bacterium]|nr:sel1 repeat family protein [Bacteroidaceae bacterium]
MNAEELYKKGMDYSHAGNIDQAFPYFVKAANQGHPDAQAYLGYIYEFGYGVTKDLQKAAYWKKKYEENPNKE